MRIMNEPARGLATAVVVTMAFLVSVSAAPPIARAAATVCGTLSGDTTWSAGNVYEMTCSVVVPAGVILSIQPGVTVMPDQLAQLEVHGALLANGSATSPIVFSCQSLSLCTRNLPAMIQISNAGGAVSSLSNVDLEDAGTALEVDDGANANLANMDFTNNNTGLSVRCCTASVTIVDSQFAGNGNAVTYYGPSHLTINRSTITGNGEGLDIESTPSDAHFNYDSIYNNRSSSGDIEVFAGPGTSASATIDATNNYWGAPTGPDLSQFQMRDCTVDPTRACVTFTPYLNAPYSPPPAPIVTPTVGGTLGSNGWYISDVTVSWSVSGQGTVISSESGCDPTTFTMDTAGTTVTCVATSIGGTTSRSVIIKRDATPPTVTGTPDRSPDHNGWYNHPVTVSWSGNADDISGIANCDPATPYSSPDSGTASVSGHCTDGAGNVGTGSYSFKYDATKPTISEVLTPSGPASTGWYNIAAGAPTVTFPCSDATSGVDGSCPAPYTFPEGANQSYSASVSDVAGNTNSAGVSGVNVDLTPPTCTVTMTPSTIWPPNRKMVSVSASVTVADGGSGAKGFVLSSITSNEGSVADEVQGFSTGQASTSGQVLADRSGSGTGRVYTFAYTAMDKAGNTSTCSGTVTVPHDQGQ